jgi:hypothetical protein
MTVAELIKQLEKYGPEHEVRIETSEEVDRAGEVELDGRIIYIVGEKA